MTKEAITALVLGLSPALCDHLAQILTVERQLDDAARQLDDHVARLMTADKRLMLEHGANPDEIESYQRDSADLYASERSRVLGQLRRQLEAAAID